MTEKFKWDLQRFADGDEDNLNQSGTTGEADSTMTPETTPQQEQKPDYYIDDDGLFHFEDPAFDFGDDGQMDEQKDDEVQPTEQTPPQDTTPPRYTPDELKSMDFDKVDYNRLPPEMQPFYRSMQAGYTRANQQLAEQRRALQENQQPQVPQQPAQPALTPAQQEKAFYEVATAEATQKIKQLFEEDYNEANPVHNAVFADTVREVRDRINTNNQRQAKMAELVNEFASDPDFAEMDVYAQERINTLPTREGLAVMKAIQTGDADALRAYFNAIKIEFKTKKTGITPTGTMPNLSQIPSRVTPPVLESAGNGNLNPQPQQALNPRELRTKSLDSQVDWVKNNLL